MSRNEPRELALESATGVERPLVLKFGGSLVEQLGAQLYPSVTATVAELISNAWDADAEHVWVTVPFEEDWNQGAELVVLDDGHGMTRSQAQEAYLVVGRKKRLTELGDRSEGGRLVHGRKGIGKLAAFGTAGYLECTSLRDGRLTSFGIDYDEVRLLNPDQNYYVDDIRDPAPLTSPDGGRLEHGTRVRLTNLRVKRKISADAFQTSMSRRFALREMEVLINGRRLERFDIPLQFKLPADEAPDGVSIDQEGWGIERLPSGDLVRWWIGFTEKPLADSEQQGISVLARNKMAQRPFKFEKSQGTTAQLGLEYLVGEVEADWLDQGDDIDSDYIQSNRDQLQVENTRLDEFMEWGRRRLTWALRVRQELRDEIAERDFQQNEELTEIISGTSAREKRALIGVAHRLARLPEIDQIQVNSIMRSVVDSRSEAQARVLDNQIQETQGLADEMSSLISQSASLDAPRLISMIESRLIVINKLDEAVLAGVDPLEMAKLARENLWIIDPRLHMLNEEVELASLVAIDSADVVRHSAKELIIVGPKAPAPIDELALIRFVAAAWANPSDVVQLRDYAELLATHLAMNSLSPLLRGLMVAMDYTAEALTERARLERVSRGAIRFKSWQEALSDARELHRGWLAATRNRIGMDH